MDLGWVGMTQVGSEVVRTSRWTPRQRLSGTTGGDYCLIASGRVNMSQVWSRVESNLVLTTHNS